MSGFGSRVSRFVKRAVFGPRVPARAVSGMTRLGSEYGGWEFVDLPQLHGATILSCGLGEDATFDVEFARRYGARVVIVDPTPRAVTHFHAVCARLGRPAEAQYSSTGSQRPEAYDLTGLEATQLMLVPKALTDRVGTVRFFAPSNPSDVSHSVINFQNGYSMTTPFIEVPSIDIRSLLTELGIVDIALAKFDIEAAEITVIPQMLDAGVLPTQVLVEFDELNRPSRRARANFELVHARLLQRGYSPVFFDRRSCVSYLRTAAP